MRRHRHGDEKHRNIDWLESMSYGLRCRVWAEFRVFLPQHPMATDCVDGRVMPMLLGPRRQATTPVRDVRRQRLPGAGGFLTTER